MSMDAARGGSLEPTLLTQAAPDRDDLVYLMAVACGVLNVNACGAFQLDDHLLLAPYGSVASKDPLGIEIPGVGFVAVGQTIRGSGGYSGVPDRHRHPADSKTHGIVLLNDLPDITVGD